MTSAADLLGPLMKYTWDYYLIAYLVTIGGVMVHWIQKCVKDKLDFVQYWTTNKFSSVLVFISATTSFFVILMTDPNPNLMTFVGISYMVDSMLNKGGGPAHARSDSPRDPA